ncbi:uncharacterized protein LOC134252666 [Saccostrea cucullata]|uniref:uncharacterized protein LOC134252666 n=1 Tax=Saccostrea cuccullata TaxID=36930 RepID=UPI002ED1C012
MVDTTEFYLVQEGIKRNKESIRLQDSIGLMIWNRAHAELTYLQEIESWKDKVQSEESRDESDGKGLLDFVKPALTGEADRAAEIHRDIYNKLMSKTGPYQNIIKHTRMEQETSKRTRLKAIEEEFNSFNRRRSELEHNVKKQTQSVDSMKLRLDGLEQKLSKRSRLTDGRRSARGMRKLDSINAQVSQLRKRIETSTASCKKDEAELQDLIGSKRKTLKKMFQELKELDKGRLTVIHKVIMQYVTEIIPSSDAIRESIKEVSKISKNLQTVDIEEIHNHNWDRTENKARLKKAGLVMGFDMFLVTNPSLRTQDLDLTEQGKEARDRVQAIRGDTPLRGSVSDEDLEGLEEDQPHRAANVQSAQSVSSCPSKSNTTPNKTPVMKKPSLLVSEISPEESNLELETIQLVKDDTRCRLPTPFTVKPFCVRKEAPGPSKSIEEVSLLRSDEEDLSEVYSNDESDERSDEYITKSKFGNDCDDDEDEGFEDPSSSRNHVVEFDSKNVRLYSRLNVDQPESMMPTLVDGDIGTLRNIRVIANRNYKARTINELNLKKGQVVKQKIGENEDGFAYGWTRESKLSSKQYGWYPISVVSYK